MNLVERVARRAAEQTAGMGGQELHDLWKKQEPHFRQVLHEQSKQTWHLKEIKGPTEHGEVTIVWESPGQGSLALYGTSMSAKQNDVRLHYNDAEGMPEQPKVMRVPNEKMGDPSVLAKLLSQYKGKTEWTKAPKKEAVHYQVAARYLLSVVADQSKAAPKKVDDLFKEVKDGNPGYSDEQAWATAWSIYCKHVDPNGEHCHKGPGGYLKEAEIDPHAQVPKKLADAAWEWVTSAMDGLRKVQHIANEEVRNVTTLAEKLAVKAYAKEAEKAMHMVTGVFGRRMTASDHQASEAAKVRGYLAKSIKHMKDITGPKWEKFAKENPGLAAASVHMAAQDAIRAMEEADKLLSTTKEAAAVREGDEVEITKGKEKGLKGTVKHTKAGPHGNQLAVELDHPVHRMMGPAIIDPGAVKKIGTVEGGRYRSFPRDPHWINAKFPGVAADGTPFKAGEKVLYWPNTKTVMVGRQAEEAWKRFEAEAADEAMYGGYRAAGEGSVERPTPMSSIERPTPSAAEEVPDTHDWEPYEKRGEWNLLIYHPGGRRNLSYFMKNPSGGGGGSNDGPSVGPLVKRVIHQTGWNVPHINPHKKDKVWVSVLQLEGENWKPVKQWWEPVPKELLEPKEPKKLTEQEHWEMATR